MSDRFLRPFFGYYGGKWRDTPRLYPAPRYGSIVEPFAGSAGYSLRHHERAVVLCDLDPVIVGVWQYLLRVSPAEVMALPDVPLDSSVEDLHLPQEAWWLIGFWLNRGVARPRRRPSRWMREGLRPGSFWGSRVRETIASQVCSIRHWKIIHGSYESCTQREPATWFVDPPYQAAGKHYRHGSAGLDYEALSRWCRSRRGQVIVCESQGAHWLPFRDLGEVKTARPKRSREVCWTSHTEAP